MSSWWNPGSKGHRIGRLHDRMALERQRREAEQRRALQRRQWEATPEREKRRRLVLAELDERLAAIADPTTPYAQASGIVVRDVTTAPASEPNATEAHAP